MRKATIILGVLAALLGVLAAPAQASVPSAATAPAAAANHQTGWKMGALPAQSTLCVAEGVDGIGNGYNYEYVIGQLNNVNYGPTISIRNTCTGYSIQNRLTINGAVWSGTTCAQFSNTHRTFSASQGYAIWDQNPIITYNLSDYCIGEDTVRAHRTNMYLEYILGLQYHSSGITNCTIGSTSASITTVKYPTNYDWSWLGNIYGGKV